MKPRLKMDGFLLSLVILATLFMWSRPHLYAAGFLGRDMGPLIAVGLIFLGAALRVVARGYKKAHSDSGAGLVQDGPYRYVRNPMYLGTFLIGAGFILVAWPWWGVPLFAVFFYWRFSRQIGIEERHLGDVFGATYTAYCARVPRVFPSWSGLRRLDLKADFPWSLAWTTNESRIMFILPAAAVAVKLVTDGVVFQHISWARVAVYAALWTGWLWAVTRARPRE